MVTLGGGVRRGGGGEGLREGGRVEDEGGGDGVGEGGQLLPQVLIVLLHLHRAVPVGHLLTGGVGQLLGSRGEEGEREG